MSDEFKWAIERQIPHMRRYALALTRDRETADDLVQDSLERALRKRHLWHKRGSMRGWLFRILYRKCIDHYRKVRPETVPADTELIDATLAQPPNQEDRIDCRNVCDALERLPKEQRAVVLLVALEGLPYDEVAEITDTPIGTVRSRLSRARETLRTIRETGTERERRVKLRMIK